LKRYAGKSGATGKSVLPNAGNAIPYGYAGKPAATGKSGLPNACNAVGYGYITSNFSRNQNYFCFCFVVQYAVL